MPVDKAVLIKHRMDRANETLSEANTALHTNLFIPLVSFLNYF